MATIKELKIFRDISNEQNFFKRTLLNVSEVALYNLMCIRWMENTVEAHTMFLH